MDKSFGCLIGFGASNCLKFHSFDGVKLSLVKVFELLLLNSFHLLVILKFDSYGMIIGNLD